MVNMLFIWLLNFLVFKYFRRSDLAQPFRTPPPGFRTPHPFVVSAVSSLFRRLLARRISERSNDRKYVFVCRLVVCMKELLIYRPFQFYSEKNFEFTCKSLDHSASGNSKKHSTYTEQIRNWNELKSVKVKFRYKVKCGGVATYAPAPQTINHRKCQRCWHGEAAKSP